MTQQIAPATTAALDKRTLRNHLAAASGIVAKAKAAAEWWKSTRPGRMLARVGVARGNLLAGGIAYAALFSLFAALALGFTIFMLLLGNNVALRDQVLSTLNTALPGIIDDGSGGLIAPEDLVLDTAITPTSVVATGVLLWSALAMMEALKHSIRAMFGIVVTSENPVLQRLRSLVGFVVLALSVLVTSVLSLAVSSLGGTVLDAIGVEGALTATLLRLASLLVALLVDGAVYVLLFTFVAGVRVPRRDLLLGAGLGAVGSGVLRVAGTSLIGGAGNPLLASAAALITILLWVNLVARVTLHVAAFTANPPAPVLPLDAAQVRYRQRPNYVTLSAPDTLEWDHQPVTGTIIPAAAPVAPAEEPAPRWGGLMGRWKRRRIERLERKLERARAAYYRVRPGGD